MKDMKNMGRYINPAFKGNQSGTKRMSHKV
jgi:hypothetical protein